MSLELQPVSATQVTFWQSLFGRMGKILKLMARHLPFLLVFFVYLQLTGLYARATPAWETPDEPSHFAYVRYIQEHGGPPIQSFEEGKNEVETGHHPPLYYFMGRFLIGDRNLADFKQLKNNPWFSFGNNDGGANVFQHENLVAVMPNSLVAVETLRNLSLWFGAGTLLVTYLIGLLIFGPAGMNQNWRWAANGRIPATLAAVGVGFLPQFSFLSGAINNDNAIIFFCTLTLYGCFWLILRENAPRWWEFALLGGVVGLGLLSKYNEIAYIPVVGLAIAMVAWRARSWRLFITGAIVSGAACLLVSGWWFVRSQILYGDPAGWGMWHSSFNSVYQPGFEWTNESLSRVWSRWFNSFWGVFGWMNLPLEANFYKWLARLMLIAGLGLSGLILGVVLPDFRKLFAPRNPVSATPAKLIHSENRAALILIFLALSFGLVLLSAFNYAASFGDAGTQGRYLFPALPVFMLGAAAGSLWFPGLLARTNLFEKIMAGVGWVIVGLAAFGLIYLNLQALNNVILPAYNPPPDLVVKALPNGATEVRGGEFGPGMGLAGYEIEQPPANLKSGQTAKLKLTLYWRAQNTFKDNWISFSRLYLAGNEIGKQDGPPGQGHYQTYKWKKGELIKDVRYLLVTGSNWQIALANRNYLRFQIGWYRGGERANLLKGGQDYYFDWHVQ